MRALPSSSGGTFLQSLLAVGIVAGLLFLALLSAQSDAILQSQAMVKAEDERPPTDVAPAIPSPTATATRFATPRVIPTGTNPPPTETAVPPTALPTRTPTATASVPPPTATIAAPSPTGPTETALPTATTPPTETPAIAACQVIVPAGWEPYVVRMGDNLYGLARRSGASQQRIMDVNCIRYRDRIYAGYVIYLPSPVEPTATAVIQPGIIHPTPTPPPADNTAPAN